MSTNTFVNIKRTTNVYSSINVIATCWVIPKMLSLHVGSFQKCYRYMLGHSKDVIATCWVIPKMLSLHVGWDIPKMLSLHVGSFQKRDCRWWSPRDGLATN